MRILPMIIYILLTFGGVHQGLAVSSLDFVQGRDDSFNRVFVKKLIRDAIKVFSKTGKPSLDFEQELKTFLEQESSDLYLKGEAAQVKRTKFFFTFFVKRDSLLRTHITFFSEKTLLSTWDLTDFSRVGRGYSDGAADLPPECKKMKESAVVDFYATDFKSGACYAVQTRETLGHPIYKGYVDRIGVSQSERSVIVKKLMHGMTNVPVKVQIFGRSWRLPVSRFSNGSKINKIFMP